MKTNTNIPDDFYQNLGKLFFAIAAADGNVEAQEINALKKFVKSHWSNIDTVDGKTKNQPNQIELIFDQLNNESPDPERCFNEFIDYKTQNPKVFTEYIVKLILKTASAIANSFSSLNKSELIMLAKLDMALKK